MTLSPPANAPAYAPQGRRDRTSLWSLIDAAILYLTLAASTDMLVQLGPIQSLVWLTCYGLTLIRVITQWPQFLSLVSRNTVLIYYPLACIASVLWSYSRGESLVLSIQLTMTMVIATYLGWRYTLPVLIKVLAIVISVAAFLSLIHWATGVFPWPVYTRAGGLAGFFSHKNMLGQRALFGGIAILTIWFMYRSEASQRFKLFLTLPFLINLYVLYLSKSITALLMFPVLAGLLLLLCLGRMPRGLAASSVLVALLLFALGPLVLAFYGTNPVDAVLDGVGKSSTLTGRTELWAVAREVIADHPVFGIGYGAFWNSAAFLNERIMTQEAGATTSRSFHNFVFEILVSAGWPALLAMTALIVAAFSRLGRQWSAYRRPAAAGAIVLVIGFIIASLVGTTLYRGHEHMIILLIAFMVAAREDERAATRRPRSAQNRA